MAEDQQRMIAPLPDAAYVALMGAMGFGLAALYFAALRRTATLIASGAGWRLAIALTVARAAGAIAVLGLTAQWGATALLAALAGFVVARSVALRRIRSIG